MVPTPSGSTSTLTVMGRVLTVGPVDKKLASQMVVENHYLHRSPPMSFSFGLHWQGGVAGVVTFGTPGSRHLTIGVSPSSPELVIELNRLWVTDDLPRNTESWFVSRALHMLPPLIVVSYADTSKGHMGYIYRALNFHYAGWTDMERLSPRMDYIPASGGHTRDAFRGGANWTSRVPRKPKVKYWTVTGDRRDRKRLTRLCQWPSLRWQDLPPPTEHVQHRLTA